MRELLPDEKKRSLERKFQALVLLVVLVNLVLKVIYVRVPEIAMDEPFTLWWAQHNLLEIWGMLRSENNPVLHFLFMHFWVKYFGLSPLAVRIPSIIFSSVTAGIILKMVTRNFNVRAGIMATLIFTLSTMHMAFAHEARPYSLFVMLAAWNLMLGLELLKKEPTKRVYIWFFISSLLLVYTHYLGWIPVLTQAFCFLLFKETRRKWHPLLWGYTLLLIAYIPQFYFLFLRMGVASSGTWVRSPQWSELYGNINRFLNDRGVTIAILLTGILVLITTIIRKKLKLAFSIIKKHQPFAMIAVWFLVPYLGMFAISFIWPVFLDRYLLFTSIGIYILVAALIDLFSFEKWIRIVFIAVLMITMLRGFTLNPGNGREVKKISALVREQSTADIPVVISPDYSYLEFVYHYDINMFRCYQQTKELLMEEHIFPLRHLGDLKDSTILKADEVIYLDCGSEFAFGENTLKKELSVYFKKSKDMYHDSTYTITRFSK